MESPPLDRVEVMPEGDVVLPEGAAPRLLNADPDAFGRDLRAGRVFSLVERGAGEDGGRLRLTLRWRAREIRVVAEAATGRVLAIERR